MKKTLTLVGVVATSAALALSGCAQAPGTDAGSSAAPSASTSGGAGAAAFKACMVSDSGGFDDKSFNQTAYKGLTDAKTTLGIETGQVESNAAADYAKNVQSMVDAKCNIIVTVGFALSDDTLAAAKANPDIKFAIVDNNDPSTYPAAKNLKPLVFNTAQSSFLAGYVAAGMSQTKKVGHLRRAEVPDGHDLHGRLRPGRGVLQHPEEGRRAGARLGRGQAGRPVRRQLRGPEGRPARRPGPDQPGRGHRPPGRRPGRSRRACRRPRPAAARSTRSGSTPTAASARRPTAPASSPA